MKLKKQNKTKGRDSYLTSVFAVPSTALTRGHLCPCISFLHVREGEGLGKTAGGTGRGDKRQWGGVAALGKGDTGLSQGGDDTGERRG